MITTVNMVKIREADLRGKSVGDKAGEIVVSRECLSVSQKILKQVFDDPAADHGIVRHDQDRDHGVDPAAGGQEF